MINLIELNTMSNPRQGFRDETQKLHCEKCRNWFKISRGMTPDHNLHEITKKHLELCEGDAAVTLMKVEQWWKATHS